LLHFLTPKGVLIGSLPAAAGVGAFMLPVPQVLQRMRHPLQMNPVGKMRLLAAPFWNDYSHLPRKGTQEYERKGTSKETEAKQQ